MRVRKCRPAAAGGAGVSLALAWPLSFSLDDATRRRRPSAQWECPDLSPSATGPSHLVYYLHLLQHRILWTYYITLEYIQTKTFHSLPAGPYLLYLRVVCTIPKLFTKLIAISSQKPRHFKVRCSDKNRYKFNNKNVFLLSNFYLYSTRSWKYFLVPVHWMLLSNIYYYR